MGSVFYHKFCVFCSFRQIPKNYAANLDLYRKMDTINALVCWTAKRMWVERYDLFACLPSTSQICLANLELWFLMTWPPRSSPSTDKRIAYSDVYTMSHERCKLHVYPTSCTLHRNYTRKNVKRNSGTNEMEWDIVCIYHWHGFLLYTTHYSPTVPLSVEYTKSYPTHKHSAMLRFVFHTSIY